MKKSKLILILSLMVLMTLVFVYIRLSSEKNEPVQPKTKMSTQTNAPLPLPQVGRPSIPSIAPAPLKKGNRSFYGTLPLDVDDIQDLKMVNKPSVQWQKKLEVNLKRLGGEKLKTLEVLPQESYIIPEGNQGRLVERVIVKLESKDGEYTSFFAEVDSESGHVIKTWGVAIPEKSRHRH